MKQGSVKRAKPNVNIQNLPSSDRELLERAAALLNKSVSQLLDGATTEERLPYPQGNLESLFPLSHQMPTATHAPPAHSQAWLPGAQLPNTKGSSSSSHRNHSAQARRGTITELEGFDAEPWQNVDMMPNGSAHVVEVQQPNWNALATVGGPASGGIHGPLDPSGEDSDMSSESSDHETHMHDMQPWEEVQIAGLEPIPTLPAPSGFDTFWLADSETIQVDIPNGSAQLLEAGGIPNALVSTHQHQKGRRPFQNETLRTETSNTRKLKACVRCRMQKIRVSEDMVQMLRGRLTTPVHHRRQRPHRNVQNMPGGFHSAFVYSALRTV